MKKIIALILCAVMAAALVSCASKDAGTTTGANTEPQTTEESHTGSDTAEPVTTEPVTTEPVTTEPVTTEPETTEPEATDPETTDPETTEPETTEPVTTDQENGIPDNAYVFDKIYVIKPDNYTFKDFSGFPSGLKNGVDEGQCFFNFGKGGPLAVMDETAARAFTDSSKGMIGENYSFDGFSSYEVDGVPVTKIDYTWENGAIIQSIVYVYFEDSTVFIQFATLSSITEGADEFNAIINTLGIIK